MATVNYDYSFTPNTAAKATEVNGNFNKIKQFAEDISTGTSIDAGAISTAKIADAAVTTAKIANSSVTADKIANGSVTGSKLPANTFAVTYQDFSVPVDLVNNPYGQTVSVFLTGGKNYGNVIGVVAFGLNSHASTSSVTIGPWTGVTAFNEVKVWVALGNNVASNNVTVRVWLTA